MDEDIKTEPNDDPENDVEIINKTIPEVFINETSFDEPNINSGDRANTNEESFAIDTAPTEIAHTTHSLTDATFDEQQLIDWVVVDDHDDDISPPIDVKDVKSEPKCSADVHHRNDENLDIKPNLSLPQKSDIKNEEAKETKPKIALQPEKDIFLVHCAIKQSLSNETFVLQLDNSDALDSYLDKTATKLLDEKPLNNLGDGTENKGGESGDMKENDSNQLNVPASKRREKEKICDALILTADDELETELSLEEKNGKASNKRLEPDKTTVSEECSAATNSLDTNKLVIPKTELTMEVVKKDECSNLNEKETKVQDKPDKKTDTSVADNKTRNVSATTSRVLWVSNVTQSVRATDLKKYLTKIGKVVTAKIVTDGKNCYGYVLMDNSDNANKCLETLNNAYFEGRKISLSFTRPPRSSTDKKGDLSKSTENDKLKPTKKEPPLGNETDDIKIRTSKERSSKASKSDTRKRCRSHSRSLSSRVSKRKSPNDPLTTKFDARTRTRSGTRRKSRSSDRHDRKYLREKQERERLQRNLLEEQRRSRNEMIKQIRREEKQREMEFKLEQERRKLQLERELFEKERRELTRLDVERRNIERERLEVLKQRSKLQEELQKSRMTTKPDKFSLSSVISKSQEMYKKRKETLKRDDDYNRKPSSSKHSFQKIPPKDSRDERKTSNDCKRSTASLSHRPVPNTDRMDFKSNKDVSKVMKSYEKTAPPPPKLTNDFDRKSKHSDRKPEYSDGKPSYGDRKPEREARKIEVVGRKYYQERSSPERKHERVYRKPEFEGRKPHVFPERKYDYGRDTKRYPDENYPERDTTQRMQWPAASVSYNDPWKAVPPDSVSGFSVARYQDPNFPTSSYGGPSRTTPFYYHSTSPPPEYPRYDHCSQVNGRKY